MFNLYIKQAAEIFGVTHTREIYEKAIEVLPDEQSRQQTLLLTTTSVFPYPTHPIVIFGYHKPAGTLELSSYGVS